ncbi:MAG: hypothetical protein ABEH81_07720 [Halopenitus sp.]
MIAVRKILLLIAVLLFFLVVGSGSVVAHEGHGGGTPSTPLEPDDDPRWLEIGAVCVGATHVVLLGGSYATDIVSRRAVGVGILVWFALLGGFAFLALKLG